MLTTALIIGMVVFGFISTSIWGMLVDQRLHRPPSEWIGSAYLGLFLGLAVAVILRLDQIRSHLIISCIACILMLSSLIWGTVRLWKHVAKLDEEYYKSRRNQR